MHQALQRIARATKDTIYENRLWLVGGAVRDELLGRPEPMDFDIVLEEDATELARFLRKANVSDIEPVIYPRFGTAMIILDGATIEFVTARKESYEDTSRKPDVEPSSIETDARRRDFTVNTLMRNLHTGKLYDPLATGLNDLKNRILRTPLEPEHTFFEDPLRMLRAVRFRWQLGFEPDPQLYPAIEKQSERLGIISFERIRDEFDKMLLLDQADQALKDLMDLKLIHQFAPELVAMVGVEQGSFHHLDAWDHTLLVVRNIAQKDLVLKLAALFHDVGKPSTRFVDEKGQMRFFGHETVGAQMTQTILERLRYPKELIEPVKLLVKNHMRLGTAAKFTQPAIRRLIRDLGEHTNRLITLTEADARALKPGVRPIDLAPIQKLVDDVRKATPAETLISPLSGEEIMKVLQAPAGPAIGKAKSYLTDQVIEGNLAVNDKQAAKRLLIEWAKSETEKRQSK